MEDDEFLEVIQTTGRQGTDGCEHPQVTAGQREAIGGCKLLKGDLTQDPEALVPGTHPRCSVCPSTWKSTSCPFRSWPTAVLADTTFTNLLKEPKREAAGLITGPLGGFWALSATSCQSMPSSVSLPPRAPLQSVSHRSQRTFKCTSSHVSLQPKSSYGFHCS